MHSRRTLLPWIVAVLAVTLALGTSAVAAPTAYKALTATKAKKIANSVVTKRAKTLTVAKAKVGLSPVAYAVVNIDGTVVAGSSRGVTGANVQLEATSAFCFYDLPFSFKTAQTTPIYDTFEANVTAAVAKPGAYGFDTDCGGASPRLEVATSVNDVYTAAPFIVWFYN